MPDVSISPSTCVIHLPILSLFTSLHVIHSSAHHNRESPQESTEFTPVKLSDPLCFQIQTPHLQISQQNNQIPTQQKQ